MSTPTSADLEGMKAAQSAFQTALDESTRAYANMDGQIEALAPSWAGQASAIFHNAMQQWLQDFDRVNSALRTMLETLAANTHLNANTHEDTQQEAQRVEQTVAGGNYGGLPGFPTS